MTFPDRGVDLLLRRATDDLRPDVDHLVAGGITRGRTRQRRARIGTAVAAVAVFGVIGAAAAVVPQLGSGPDSARDNVRPAASTSSTPTVAPTPRIDAPLAVAAADVPETVDRLLGTALSAPPLREPPYGLKDEAQSKATHFRYNGMLTSVVIEPEPDPQGACEVLARCQAYADGSLLASWGPDLRDGVVAQGGTAWLHGYEVSVISYNAADGKESPQLSPEPPLDVNFLMDIAGSPVWFG